MTSVKTAILFGNGINRVSDNSISWEDLINSIHTISNAKLDASPTTYKYEQLILDSKNAINKRELEVKEEIAGKIKEVDTNNIYTSIYNKNKCRTYITTNYDDNFLNSNKIDNVTRINKEHKYSLRRYVEFDNCRLWKIHGDCGEPKTIMLGHEQYSGAISNIYDYINGKYRNEPTTIRKKLEQDNNYIDNSWIDLFFTHNIHIVGLSLDYNESDIWYVLIKRARMKTNANGSRINNHIVYHYPECDSNGNRMSGLMKQCGIELRPHKMYNNDWSKLYKDIFSNIWSGVPDLLDSEI